MSRARIEAELPRLRNAPYNLTSPATTEYNCIAWAAQDATRWWWPTGGYFWPEDVPADDSVGAFIALFESLGYSVCGDGEFAADCDKVVIFADGGGRVKHAARQLGPNRWTSKLGKAEDVSHTLWGVGGSAYGVPAAFLSRPKGPVVAALHPK